MTRDTLSGPPVSGATDGDAIEMRLVRSLDEIDAGAWDACANPGGDVPYDPFLTHGFLQALEESGSAAPRTGWQPMHLVMDGPDGIEGAVPLYLKGHSQGEYVFDHGWADAYERAGGTYYPKLLAAVPFTPVTGRRLLTRDPVFRERTETALTAGLVTVARDLDVSSVHITFPTHAQWTALGDAGLLQRTDQQFHWENRGYASFDGFLEDLASRKRKNLRKERAAALENDVTLHWLTGADIREEHWDAFFAFYTDTGARKWGRPYLTRTFFSLIGERMADDILLVMAKRAGRWIAGALNMIGGQCLFGRYWGAVEHHPFLHFEACYYQAIDFAIERGLERVEAGAQGTHKIARGYVPRPTYSAHWIADGGFRQAVARYLAAERGAVAEDMAALADYAPFRKGGSSEAGAPAMKEPGRPGETAPGEET